MTKWHLVYEWMVYDGLKHTKIATLPGMWDRTLTIGSAGKSFSVTGYKVGWLMGPFNLIEALNCVHQNTTFSVATPLQEGIAIALEQVEARKYFETLRSMFLAKRDRLVSVLKEVGLNPVVPQGMFSLLDALPEC
jgi:aspartate/methionine/tyrosine aminotransferase